MFKRKLDFLLGLGYQVSDEEVKRQNRLAIHYFAMAGMPVAIANVVVQAIIQAVPLLTPKNWVLPCYFAILVLLDRLVIPKGTDKATLLVYLVEAPVMVISILLGTVWDPTHQAITFLMFMSAIPVFILDTPLRAAAVQLGWNLLFVVMSALVKDPAIVPADVAHVLEFYLLSIAVTIIVSRLRVEVVYNYDRAIYHLEHDVLTDTQNRLSLEARIQGLTDIDAFVCMGSIDHLGLINDFYGKQTGDEVLGTFAYAMKQAFGVSSTYRLGGDEFLGILEAADEREGIARIERVRSEMRESHFEGVSVEVSCSFGYAFGHVDSPDAFDNMRQLANIYVHRAVRQNDGETVGTAYDLLTYQNAVIQANIDGHAEAHETNKVTGLPNLAYFEVRAQETLVHVADLSRHPMVGYLNVVGFPAYNDRYGYVRGDELLRTITRLLKEALPGRHITYVSGSKFALVCYEDEMVPALERVLSGLRREMADDTLQLKAGFARYAPGDTVIALVDRARLAHIATTPTEECFWRVYDEGLDEETRLNRYLVAHLDEAIEKEWLKVYYQPIMWSDANRIANLEALSRWDDPTFGMLPPYKFIGVLEHERLVYKLSLHVVRRVLKDIRAMRDQGLPIIPVSVNLSRLDFIACDMVSEIANLVEEAGLEPWVLSIEITESAFTESQEMLEREVERFHERGFAVWMDDFGSEYSTLNLLEELDFDLVKLDMFLMRHFTAGSRNAIIVSSILEMCGRLGMETLVEGVEDTSQAELLREMGAGKLQGFLYSRPLPFDEVVALIRERGWV